MSDLYRITCQEFFQSYGDQLKVRITRILTAQMYTYWTSAFNIYILSGFHLLPLTDDAGTAQVSKDTVDLLVREVGKRQLTLKKFYRDEDGTVFNKVGEYITRDGRGETYGATEISPINSTLGDVTTPNTKTNGKTNATSTDFHETINDRLKALNATDENNIIQIFLECIRPVIYELNEVY